MSTLGGSRGERNAKPKFSALDINRMYKNSRGETTEPSAQKNQVPRKHGMQSLGKVPSARRPPANLPSLKAETTSSPTIANNNIGPEGGVQNQTSGSNQLKNTTSGSNSNSHITTSNNSNSNINSINPLSSNQNNNSNGNNSSSTVIGVGSKLINNSSSVSKGGGGSSGGVGNQSHHHHHSQQKPITWSAVTTGNDNQRGGKPTATVPPLYQSPQFQHEFPTLDGTVGGGGSGGSVNANRRSGGGGEKDYQQQQQHHHSNSNHQNYHHQQRGGDYHGSGGGGGGRHHHQQRNDAHSYRDGNEGDGGRGQGQGDISREMNEVSLRPQTNAAAWLEQQEKNAKGAAAENQTNHQGQGPQHGSVSAPGAAVPLPILTLMPSFMQRGVPLPPNGGGGGGGGTSTSTGGRSQTPPNYQNGIIKDTSSSSANIRPQARGNAQDYRSSSSTGAGSFRQSAALPKRPPLLSTPPPANGGGNSQRKDKEYIVEPEVAQMQRPIIREEELERMNAIANDDSWTKQEEIDYTKKLNFSDDDSPEETPTQERDRPLLTKNNSNFNDLRKNSNASATSSLTGTGSWQRKDRESLERDKSSSGGDHMDDTRHQNGHRPGGNTGCIQMDAGVYKRVKLRKEEEERREMERKQAAARKKQELEMKMNSKKSSSDNYDQQHSSTSGSVGDDTNQVQGRRSAGSYDRSNITDRGTARMGFDSRDMRGGGDYSRGIGNAVVASSGTGGSAGINSSAAGSGAQPGSKAVFSAQFQSNLPPRFQRQQQLTGAVGAAGGNNSSNSASGRAASNAPLAGLEKSSTSSSNYENTRYMQKGAGTQRGAPGGGPRGEYRDNYNRGGGYRSRNDSDRDDDRYHGRSGVGGREDYGRGLTGPNQLSRSVSDTSQRKTSVSSNDNDSVKQGYGGESTSFGSGIVSSWAEETEVELKRQRDESFSSSHSHESIPIKILQRPHTQKSVSEEEEGLTSNQSKQHRNSESSDHLSSSSFAPTQILKRSESSEHNKPSTLSLPQSENQVANSGDENPEKTARASDALVGDLHKPNDGSKQNVPSASNSGSEITDSHKSQDHEVRAGSGPQPQREKRPSPRSGGSTSGGAGRERDRDMRVPHSRSFGASGTSYRGSRDAGWNQRSGNSRGSRYQNSDDQYQDNEDDDIDDGGYSSGRRSERSPKIPRKDVGGGRGGDRGPGGRGGGSDERGFAPRGEPSRRGRGGGGNIGERGITSSSYRRTNDGRSSASGQRQYGRQAYQDDHKDVKRTSESSETNTNELDKTKQNQMALSAGLSKVKDKDTEHTTQSASPAGSHNASKQTTPPQPQQQLKKSNDENKNSQSTTPPKQQQQHLPQQTRKEGLATTKPDEDIRRNNSNVDREKKSTSKEKDIPLSGSGTSPSGTSASTRSTNANGACATTTSSGVQSKKQDLPITTLPNSVAQQSSIAANSKLTTQPSPLQQQNQTSNLNKSSAGVSGMKSAGSSASIASIGSNPPPKSSPELQKMKTEAQAVNILPGQKLDNDKNKLGSLGSLSVDSKSNNGGLLIDGAPVSTIIFENTNYKQQVQAAQMKCSSESLAVSSSVVSGVNVSVAGVDTLTNALSQMTFGGNSGKQTEVTAAQKGPSNDYDKEMKLGFSFGDATESYTTATKGIVTPNTGTGDNEAQQSNVAVQQQQQQQQQSQSQPSLQQQTQANLHQQQTPQHQQQQQQQQQHSQQAQNIISAADLNMKIASVKKVWESVQPMASEAASSVQQLQQQQLHHQQQQQMETVDTGGHMTAASFVAAVAASQQQQQQHMPHYAVAAVHMQHHALSSPGAGVPSAFGGHASPFDAGQLEPQFGQNASGIVVGANDDASAVGYPSPQQQQQQQQQSVQQQQQQQALKHSSEVTKQQQQVSAAAKQMQQHHSSSMGMSPPPNMQQQQQHQPQQQQQQQQSATQQQMHAPQPFYQASPQFTGIPTIPSPPAVVFNSSQMPPPPSQGGLYAPFHSLDHSSRSQFSAAAAHSFPGHYGAAAAAGGPFNAYPMQTPPNMATAPTPEMYSNLTSQFRMGGGPSPFGNPNSQQLNNPNAAVAIISSNSNSLMSTVGAVKPPPTSQQLGTIGSKAAAGGGPFAAAQQYMNLYAPGHPQHPQGGPPGPPPGHQLQSNSYYSNSAGGPSGPAAFYGGPPPQGAGANAQSYGLATAASLYGQHAGHQGGPPGSNGPPGPPQGPPGPQSQHTMSSFNTQFMNSQLLTAAAINQFRGGPISQQQAAAAAYMKSSQQQTHLQDSMGRQLKSPLGADVSLNLVKHAQSQPSPPHHKNYGSWDQVMQQQAAAQQQQQQSQQAVQQRIGGGGPGANNQNMNPNNRAGVPGGGPPPGSQASQQGRYPTPIQRPTNYPQHPQGPQSQQQVQQQQQQVQQQQQAQRGQPPQNLRQPGNSNSGGGPQSGPGGPQGGANVGGAPGNGGGPGGSVGNNQAGGGTGNSQSGSQPQQMNKPYYANNSANAGPNRANHN